MDLATRFNVSGIVFYEEGRGEDAFEMFHASLQVMLRTMGLTTADMDPRTCKLLALHESVYNALTKENLLRNGLSFGGCQNVLSSTTCGESSSLPAPLHQDIGRIRGSSSSRLVGPTTRCERTLNHSKHRPRCSVIGDEDHDPCLYVHAFAWSPGTPCSSQDIYHYVIAVAADLYNMAIVLHRGLVMDRMSGCFERALILYSFAGELLWNNLGGNLLFTMHDGMRLSSLYCAIVNNTGYLLHQMGHYDWSHLFFQRLHQFLASLGPASSAEEQKERDGFQLNIVVLFRNQTAAAAA